MKNFLKLIKGLVRITVRITKFLSYYFFYFVISIIIFKLCFLQVKSIRSYKFVDKSLRYKFLLENLEITKIITSVITVLSTLEFSTNVFNLYYYFRPIKNSSSLLIERFLILIALTLIMIKNI